MTTDFRSFFRFLLQKGEIGTDLAASVPSVPDWRQATVPKHLTPEEVQRVLGACNRRTASGRRDYVILIMLARLGLRAGEVVSLQLDDIDWRAGEILIGGKGLRHDRMPLPNDVGQGSGILSAPGPASMPITTGIRSHECPTPWIRRLCDIADDCSFRDRACKPASSF